MLTAEQLAAIRATREAAMTSTALIRPRTEGTDSSGAPTESFTDGTSVKCRVGAPSGGMERAVADKLAPSLTVTITVPLGTVLAVGDQLVITGRTYTVQALYDGGSFGTALRALCTEKL